MLLSKAADSICDGDLVDRRIRSRQIWSLLPTQVTQPHSLNEADCLCGDVRFRTRRPSTPACCLASSCEDT